MPIKPHILKMAPYLPPLEGRDSASHCLLDFNERTVPTSTAIIDAISAYIHSGKVQQYPAYGNVCSRLAKYTGVESDCVMITNGSDQGIDIVFRAYAFEGGEVVLPGPSFAMYSQCAEIEGLKAITPEYDKTNGYPLTDVLSAVNENTAIIVVSNPNNPCGTLVDTEQIICLAKAAPNAAILVDECYFEYSKQTVVSEIKNYPNIIVIRTFSKTWGMPSLRFGYLIAVPEIVTALCNVRGPYDVNQVAVVAANTALDSPEEVNDYVDEVMLEAKPNFEQWLADKDIPFWNSSANYLWVFPKHAEKLNAHLIAKGFLVRPKAYRGKLGLRVTIGTKLQMGKLKVAWETFTI